MEPTKKQYEFALTRIEDLLKVVNDETPSDDSNAIELSVLSDLVIGYEKKHYPIEKPTVGELIRLSLQEQSVTQKELAAEIGVSPSRISEYVSGRSEPTLKIARQLCLALHISPDLMLGI